MSVEYISVYKCRQKTNSMKYSEYIKQIEIDSLWSGKRHIVWNLDRKVNILSGINGVGNDYLLCWCCNTEECHKKCDKML